MQGLRRWVRRMHHPNRSPRGTLSTSSWPDALNDFAWHGQHLGNLPKKDQLQARTVQQTQPRSPRPTHIKSSWRMKAL